MFLSKHKNGYYYLFYTDEQTGIRKMISTKAKYKNDALQFLKTFNQNLQSQNINISLLSLQDAKRFVMNYLQNNVKQSTYKNYIYFFNVIMKHFPADKLLLSFSIQDVENLKAKMSNIVTVETINGYIKDLKRMFNILRELNILSYNPLANAKKIKVPVKEVSIFKDYEINLIANAITDTTVKNIFLLATETGMRLSEIINLTFKDIDYKNGIIHVRNTDTFTTKTGNNRVVLINENVQSILSNCNKNIHSLNNDYIFLNANGYKLTKDYISHYFKRITRKLNLPEHYHFHLTRHHAISKWLNSGVSLPAVMEVAGHKQVMTTQKYLHTNLNEIKSAFKKLS